MTDTQALAFLGLRRIQGRITIAAEFRPASADDVDPGTVDLSFLAGGDRPALGRVMQRAVERAWLTVELLFSQEKVAPRLGRGGQQTLDDVFGSRCFDQLNATPAPFRPAVARELHAAREAGLLGHGDVDVEDLLRQVAALPTPTDPRAVHELEWYALWQAADALARCGYPALRGVLEARTEAGDSLLVGLVASFVPYELAVEGNTPQLDSARGILPADHVRWLCEHSEPVEVLLNELQAGRPAATPIPGEAAARLRQGLALAQRGEYERAVVEFTAAIQADPTAAAFVHRADAHRLRGEYDRALADYTQALRLDPNHLPALVNRGLVSRLTGRPEAALNDLTEALRLDPRNVVALNARGAVHSDLRQYDEAIRDHTEALRLDPSLAWSHQSRGDAYAARGEYEQAIADYTQALWLNPHFPLAHVNRGDAYRLAGDLDRAAADYTEALRLDPLNPRTYISRGDVYRRQARLDFALADYGEAIRLDPTNPAGYLGRGAALQAAGEYDRAVADFDRAEQFDATNPAVFYQRALVRQQQQSYKAALADLDRAIELNPRDAVALVSRGSLYALREKFDRAVADFTEAVRLDPTSTQARLERGRVHAQRGAFHEALADCGEALRLDPHCVPAMLVRGGALLRMSEHEAALEEFDRAIATNPRYAKAYNDRGVACSRLQRFEQAVADFTHAIDLQDDYAQAYSNRANAYQLIHQHDLALRDFARAVGIDSKYAATYCVQRALVELGRGCPRLALADLTAALAIDPHNRTAKAAREEALATIEVDRHVAPAWVHVASDYTGLAGAAALVPGTQDERPQLAPESVSTEIDLIVDLDDGGPSDGGEPAAGMVTPPAARTPSEEEAYAAEAERARQEEERKRVAEMARRAEEVRRQQAEEEAKREAQRKAQAAKSRRREDPEERAERWQKRKKSAIIAAAVLVLGYYAVPALWALIPASKNPYPELTPEQFIGEYVKDTPAADDRYTDKTVVIRGQLTIVREKGKRGRGAPAPKVYFTMPGEEKIRVLCQFTDPDFAHDLEEEKEYRLVGRVQKFKPGDPIVLRDTTLKVGTSGESLLLRSEFLARGDAPRPPADTDQAFALTLAAFTGSTHRPGTTPSSAPVYPARAGRLDPSPCS